MNKNVVLLLGVDGYIGNALAQRLLTKGYKVVGVDNGGRRHGVEKEMKSYSATKISSEIGRYSELSNLGDYDFYNFDIVNDDEQADKIIKKYKPFTIINLAHNPSAPYSQISKKHASKVLTNNIIGTNNLLGAIKDNNLDCHYITISTTGTYDHYNNIDIEEGYFKINYKGRESTELIYPRRPGSIYHTSKVASTYLIDFLSRTGNLRCTDIMQSIVFGIYTDEIDKTKIGSRFDTDEAGGTVINRFIVQAILGEPLTIYGEGNHQRGFLSLNDSIQAIEIAVNNPPNKGRPQVGNQLSFWESINSLANKVKEIGKEFDLNVEFQYIDTPRNEITGHHYYNYICNILPSLGYKPTIETEDEIRYDFSLLLKDKNYLDNLKNNLVPNIEF